MAAALERRKGAWFLQGASVAGELVQHCVLPRALQSPADARYAARFLLLLHASATPFFSTLMVLDNVRPGAAPRSRGPARRPARPEARSAALTRLRRGAPRCRASRRRPNCTCLLNACECV